METHQHEFEPVQHDQFNQSLMEKNSRQTQQAPSPGFLPSGVSEYEPGSESSHWLSEVPRVDIQFDGNSFSPYFSRFSPRGFFAGTMNSTSLRSNASLKDPSQHTTPPSRTMSNPGYGTFEVSGGSFDLRQEDIALAAASSDYDLMENGFDSETGQLFLSECNFGNWQRKPAPVLPWTGPDSKLFRGSPGDWDAHRAAITKMYSDEQKTLKEIMDFMEREYGFKPSLVSTLPQHDFFLTQSSEKQYKAKLREWKITKYVPNPMAKWMAMKSEERKLQGKRGTIFQFKNQFLTEERVRKLAKDLKNVSNAVTGIAIPFNQRTHV